MSLPADQLAFDLLDAHLEAVCRGATDLPLPEVPAGLAADGAGELVAWTLDRLRSIPREPQNAFPRQVGTLLMEFRSRICPWNAALLRLLDDTYTFAATGPRRHEDWAHDVLAVMHRSARDPRGWLRVDSDRTNAARDTVPTYPFAPPAASRFPDHLYPLEPEAAAAALAIMSEEWEAEYAPVRSRPNRDAVLADARTVLDRYGPEASFWTNATAAAFDPAPDFVTKGLGGTRSHFFLVSECLNGGPLLLHDLGLIAVTDDEVGVFWSFGAI